ncbi:hypothetical protein N9Q18_00830, partial [bacterium]|nr:hypothetical protein [bacterium]
MNLAPVEDTYPALPSESATPDKFWLVQPAPIAASATRDRQVVQPPTMGPAAQQQPRSFVRYRLRRLTILGVVAAGGFAAFQYGPGLYDEYIENEPAAQEPKETDAPLAFPDPAPPSAPIRTAEFILEGLAGAPDMTYHVTTDFETNV